ncbi:hypothetical protein GCM10017688_57400 [Streptomyces ramulosus]
MITARTAAVRTGSAIRRRAAGSSCHNGRLPVSLNASPSPYEPPPGTPPGVRGARRRRPHAARTPGAAAIVTHAATWE